MRNRQVKLQCFYLWLQRDKKGKNRIKQLKKTLSEREQLITNGYTFN